MERESKTLATITFQNYFRMYKKLSGMTGTAKTEEEEFQGIYKLDVVQIPTNKPMIRKDLNDVVYKTRARQVQRRGARKSSSATRPASPCWWAPSSVENSEMLSQLLKQRGVQPRGAQRQESREGSRDRGPGRSRRAP